jgi:hypothetical protein
MYALANIDFQIGLALSLASYLTKLMIRTQTLDALEIAVFGAA